MATKRWRGDAPEVQQINTFLFAGTWEATDVINLLIGTKTLSVVAGSTTISTIIDNIVTAWLALSSTAYPEHNEITPSRSSNSLVLTMKSAHAGKPFTCTVSTTETGGGAADAQTIEGTTSTTGTVSTANSGPHVVSLASNWEGGVAPVDGDDLVFDAGNSDVLYDLAQSSISPASIKVLRGFKGKIGLPMVNEDTQGSPYFEYRETYLCYGNSGDAQACAVTIEGGAGRIKLNQGTARATWIVNDSAAGLDNGIPAVLLKGTHASNALHVNKGSVGVAVYGGETATILTLNVGYRTNKQADSKVQLGSGVTLTNCTAVVTGGVLEIASAITGTGTLTQYDGKTIILGSGGVVGLSVRGGQCVYSSTGTLGGNPVVSGSGHLDFSQDLRTKTVTNPIEVYGVNAQVSDPNKVVTSLVLDCNEGVNGDRLDIGTNVRITRGTPA